MLIEYCFHQRAFLYPSLPPSFPLPRTSLSCLSFSFRSLVPSSFVSFNKHLLSTYPVPGINPGETLWRKEYKGWETLACLWEEVTQPNYRRGNKAAHRYKGPNLSHRIHEVSQGQGIHTQRGVFLGEGVQTQLRIRAASWPGMACKLIFKAGAWKVSRIQEGFSLGSLHQKCLFLL